MLKTLLITLFALMTHSASGASPSSHIKNPLILKKLQALEQTYHIKAGIYAEDTNSGQIIAYHAHDRFPFQSTVKLIGVSALLAKDQSTPIVQRTVRVRRQDLIFWHPISGKYLNQQVPLHTLAEGAISYSDNPAINIIFHELGGLSNINNFAHRIGNTSFKLSHYEANLNSDPLNDKDTSTPQDMGLSVKNIVLGKVLNRKNKALLRTWMTNNTTGYKRIRAGVPLGWSVADKTGSGRYGIANDIGIVWSPACKPIVLSIFTISDNNDAKPNDHLIADITQAIFTEFEQHHACFKA
jgi:beta-lactamase class A